MPTYIFVSGFNGLLGIFSVFQAFQGVPMHQLPWLALLPPTTSLLSAYWGYQFCREIIAIGEGLRGDGPQDTCFVRMMTADWWPAGASTVSPSSQTQNSTAEHRDSVPNSRFSAFAGHGHTLG